MSERLTNFRSTLPDQRTSAATASVHLQPIIPADIHPQQLPSSQGKFVWAGGCRENSW